MDGWLQLGPGTENKISSPWTVEDGEDEGRIRWSGVGWLEQLGKAIVAAKIVGGALTE